MEGTRVPVQDYVPSDPRADVTFPVSVVTLRVLDVMKGPHTGQTLTFVVPGGVPGSRIGLTDTSYDLGIGDEVIVSLVFWKTVRGGSYGLRSDLGRWDASNGNWVNKQHAETSVGLDDIQAVVNAGKPEKLFEDADLVIEGTVGEIRREEQDGVGVLSISVKVGEWWKGRSGDIVDVRVIHGGGFDLDWWRLVPAMKTGEDWVLFLKKRDGGYFAFAGSNGTLRVANGRLIQNNAVDYGLSRDELRQRLLKGGRYERQD